MGGSGSGIGSGGGIGGGIGSGGGSGIGSGGGIPSGGGTGGGPGEPGGPGSGGRILKETTSNLVTVTTNQLAGTSMEVQGAQLVIQMTESSALSNRR